MYAQEKRSDRNFFAGTPLLFGLLLFFFGFFHAQAASFLLNPSVGSYAVGSVVPLDIIIDTEGEVINAVSATLSFNEDSVRPTTIKISDSLVDLWITQPAVSTTNHTISFEGLILNPGFNGKGKIATINLEILKPSSSVISFDSGSALANDGLGTNLLARFSEATLSTYGEAGQTVATRSTELPIDPSTLVLGSLRPPVVTSYTLRPERIQEFSLQGVTYPEASVRIWLQKGDSTPETLAIQADKAGNFSYQHDNPFRDLEPLLPASVFTAAARLISGTPYRFWLTAIVSGSETSPTQAFDVLVGGVSTTEMLVAFLIIIVLILGAILAVQMTSLKEKIGVRLKKSKRGHA